MNLIIACLLLRKKELVSSKDKLKKDQKILSQKNKKSNKFIKNLLKHNKIILIKIMKLTILPINRIKRKNKQKL